MHISSYPKVYNLGHAAILDIFQDVVLIEEKIDGSQWSFTRNGSELSCRSKGKDMSPGLQDKMFNLAVDRCLEVKSLMHDGWTYRGEYLSKPKHNTIKYSRAPDNNIIIFDINTGEEQYLSYEKKKQEATRLGFECVPLIFDGKCESFDEFHKLLETESILGGSKIEGMVIKNYSRFTRDGKAMLGKFVSEVFKEENKKDFRLRNPHQCDILELLEKQFRNEARWRKAVQHIRERGELTGTPKDIGPLIKEIISDTKEECEDAIKEKLFQWGWEKIKRKITYGMPEWYKEELAKKSFGE